MKPLAAGIEERVPDLMNSAERLFTCEIPSTCCWSPKETPQQMNRVLQNLHHPCISGISMVSSANVSNSVYIFTC